MKGVLINKTVLTVDDEVDFKILKKRAKKKGLKFDVVDVKNVRVKRTEDEEKEEKVGKFKPNPTAQFYAVIEKHHAKEYFGVDGEELENILSNYRSSLDGKFFIIGIRLELEYDEDGILKTDKWPQAFVGRLYPRFKIEGYEKETIYEYLEANRELWEGEPNV